MLKKYFSFIVLTLFFLCVNQNTYAEPWFTGPILANAGEVIPLGEGNFTLFNYYANSTAIYDRDWAINTIPRYTYTTINPQLIYGLAKGIDIEYDTMIINNNDQGRSHTNIGDTSIMLGFQILEQTDEHALPNLRLTLDEIFPTGRYDELNPLYNGTDSTGSGSYQTSFGFNLQYLLKLSEIHYLNTFFNINYIYSARVPLHGSSIYGGSPATRGHISPGNLVSLTLSGEYSLTQNWAAVLEGFFVYQQASSFSGFIGELPNIPSSATPRERRRIRLRRLIPTKHNIGRDDIGHGNAAEFTLFPELEYNFSKNLGIIGGAWFTTAGKNTPEFLSSSLALVVTW